MPMGQKKKIKPCGICRQKFWDALMLLIPKRAEIIQPSFSQQNLKPQIGWLCLSSREKLAENCRIPSLALNAEKQEFP